jgi:hypothetical protein
MAEEEKEKPVNPKSVKGVDTAGDGNRVALPEFRPELAYKEPKTEKEAWLSGLGSGAFESKSRSAIGGTDFMVSSGVANLYTPIDLAKGIPDQWEREKFINDNGTKMVQLLDPNKFGVRFERDLKDYAAFKQKNYNTQIKKFLDDLDENQGFLAEATNTVFKLVGKTALSVGSLIPLVYGMASGLFTWDANKIFNNGLFDAWETMDQGLDKHLAVYGGSDYYFNEKGKERNFFSRFITHPMKSLNADIAPAVSFVAGAVLTELAATALAPVTGGTTLVANTARLGAQATNLFSKGYRVIRGLDQLSDFNNMRKIAGLTQTYRAGLGTATSMVRSAGYESSLIARSTYDQTLDKSKRNYLEGQGFSEMEIMTIMNNPEMEEATIGQGVLAKMKKDAEDASEMAWFTNVPLVGFSNMIQFSKAFSSGYRVNQAISRLNPLKMTGLTAKGGKVVAKADTFKKGTRLAGYAGVGLKSGLVEGFEEYAQGVVETGYSDYWSAGYSEDSVKNTTSFLGAMTTAARNYAGSVEGFDSMSIGFLMGMLGIRLPVKVDPNTGKLTRGWESYGGIRQEIKGLREEIEKNRATAKNINDNPINPVLKNNFENMAKNITIQSEMDRALEEGDIFNYKNKEYEQLHSYVSNRIKNQIGDTVFQELDALEQLPLPTFNEQFGIDGVLTFTEETKKVAIEKMRTTTANIIEAHKQVDTAFNDTRMFADFFRKNYKGVTDPANLTEALKDQMTFLYGATKNLANRESELESEISKMTDGNVSPKVLNKIIAEIAGISKQDDAQFATTAREMYKAEMNNWKENDPTSYSLHRKQVEPLLQDLILIKERKAKIAKMYDVLFTNKGAKQFLDIYRELDANAAALRLEETLKKAEEEAKTSKSSEKVSKVKADEKSVTGTTTITDNKLADEIAATDKEIAAQLASLAPEGTPIGNLSDLVNEVDSDVVLRTLQSKPALFKEILEQLEKEGKAIPGLTNIDQLAEVLAENPTAAARISAALGAILKSYNENKEEKSSSAPLDFADPSDANQPAPSETEAGSLLDIYNTKTQQLQETSIYQPGTNVSEYSIIPVLHDKKIDSNGQLVRNPKTGRYEIWKDNNGNETDQPVDLQKVNSPEFLTNKELHNENIEATFKISKNDWNKTARSPEDIAIDVYQGDTFIGRLPAWKKGAPNHLLALRKAIVAQESGIAVEEEASVNIKTKKADIKKRKQEVSDYVLPESIAETMGVTQAGPGQGKQAVEFLINVVDELYQRFPNEGILAFNRSQIAKDSRKFSEEQRNFILETVKNLFNAKYDAELTALEGAPSRKEIIDSNFNTIITQLLKAKVNIFFNEEFKKEC